MTAAGRRPVRADPADEERLEACATDLADAVERALPGWVERCVARFVAGPEATRRARAAGLAARDELAPEVRALLATDLDDQRTTPLAILRQAVRYPTEVLVEVGVPPVPRDPLAEGQFPDDPYDLTPASLAELAPELAEPGLAWGAAKAFVFKARRRREGRR